MLFRSVIKQLPHNGREYQYRIKSANEEHERVAGEGETDQGITSKNPACAAVTREAEEDWS